MVKQDVWCQRFNTTFIWFNRSKTIYFYFRGQRSGHGERQWWTGCIFRYRPGSGCGGPDRCCQDLSLCPDISHIIDRRCRPAGRDPKSNQVCTGSGPDRIQVQTNWLWRGFHSWNLAVGRHRKLNTYFCRQAIWRISSAVWRWFLWRVPWAIYE